MTQAGVKPQVLIGSTHHNPKGTFTYVLEELAVEKGWPVREWCYRETRSDNPDIVGGWLSDEEIELALTQFRATEAKPEVGLLQEDLPELEEDREVVELLSKVDFPIVSDEFAEYLWAGPAREALRELASRARRLAVLTLGASGAIAQARDGDRVIESPGFRVEAVDTTGAGDVFHAAFIWGLLEGLSARAVLRVANAAAALSCLGLGAQGGLPSREALEAFLEAHATR